jgi:hypothetical protein
MLVNAESDITSLWLFLCDLPKLQMAVNGTAGSSANGLVDALHDCVCMTVAWLLDEYLSVGRGG